MRERSEPRSGEPVPADVDQPSMSVLDELLRAFAADPDDAERLAAIDLTSPEVAELLGSDAPGSPVDQARPPVDGETGADEEPAPIDPLLPPTVEVEPEGEGEGEAGAADAAPKTIVIADDSVPDAVYLEGDLDGPDGATTVFIDDDNTGADTYGATDATRIEPRFRARRIAVRRSAGRRRLRWVIVGTVLLVLVIAGLAVLGSSWFEVSTVEVEGATRRDDPAVNAVVEDLLGTPVLRVDTAAAEEQLEAIPWVEEAVVTTDFPHGAKIEIRDRVPVAWFRGSDGRYRVIDRQGRVLDVIGGEPRRFLPVESADPPAPEAGAFAPRGYGAAASLVDAMTPAMRQLTRTVVTTADGADLRVNLEGGAEVRFGRGEDLVNKLVRLQTVLDNESIVDPSVIDVSTAEVTVR